MQEWQSKLSDHVEVKNKEKKRKTWVINLEENLI